MMLCVLFLFKFISFCFFTEMNEMQRSRPTARLCVSSDTPLSLDGSFGKF